ncbi:spore germination protein [Tissierella sp.]|uniref:spore germination protein n=1 Tax=Tissierella sp. TaxID=41274 RepID=UPI00285B1D4C|nr:spore germination protein [Tissierella sp.]MDR7856542.1 spore germination protein [Tissierella sp.]
MISKNLEKNREELKSIFNNSSDLVLYEFDTLCSSKAMVGYIEGIVDKNGLQNSLIKPLIQDLTSPNDVLSTVPISGTEEVYDMKLISQCIMIGSLVLFIEDMEVAYLFDLGFTERRAISEPTSERLIRGSREGFVEDINVNKSLIRSRIRNTNLVFEKYNLGTETNTEVSLVYMNNIVNPDILDELRRRIRKISLSHILDSGYIEREIEDSPKSVIATISYTERPDIVAAKILEGRIAIICDGTPIVLTLPRIFIEKLHTVEDYSFKPQYGTYMRLLRLVALLISTFLPGFVVALKSFHHEMIPSKLLMSMAMGREGVPFTSLIEALLMILFFEFMKESSLRIPGNIGPAVTTISGLVLGQTAVQAGLVGPIMVITVGITGIAEFILPRDKETIVIYRLVYLFLGGILGLFGIICGIVITIVHLVSLRSFGVPYMYPIAPYDREGMKDFIMMRPMKEMNYRPRNIANKKQRKRNERNDENK